jgi:homoserine kinase
MKAEALVGRSVTVAVPATVANLGAGYDVLGLALEMTNELTVQVTGIAASGKGTVTYGASGEGAEELAPNRTNMALDAVYRGLSVAGVTGADALDLAVTAVNTIPLSRGLGSSAAAIVGGLFAGAALAGAQAGASGASGACFESFSDPLTDRLFAAADEIEGHPDNVAAAIFGGCVASGRVNNTLTARIIHVPHDAIPVVLIPTVRFETAVMRAVLPKVVSHEDAVHNASRLALGITALEAGEVAGFAILSDDRLHQPYRIKRYAALPQLFAAALNAGATSACLAGSGSSVLAIVDDERGDDGIAAVIAALNEAAAATGVGGHAEQIEVDQEGVRILRSVGVK